MGCQLFLYHIRTARIPQLRVLRQITPFKCQLFDLHKFHDMLQTDENSELLEFYDWFYTINFPDIVFADKIILYEGDTERMLIKNILQLPEFEALRNQYVSFVQVGGAYGYKYCPIIDFLGIKSVIITDLDYHKAALTDRKVLASHSTNSTIKIGDKVKVKTTATHYATGQSIASFVKGSTYEVTKVDGNKLLLSDITSWVWDYDVEKVGSTPSNTEFMVRIICDSLNIRQHASFDSKVVGAVKKGDVFTIIEEKNGLYKLKSGAGWISANSKYSQKI